MGDNVVVVGVIILITITFISRILFLFFTMLRMPFDRNDAKQNLANIDLEKILTTFKKPWKKEVFDMKKFSLVQENGEGFHSDLDFIFNDGNYTIRLFYDSLPLACIGAVSRKNYLQILQIQGTPCDDIGSINNAFTKNEQDKMRNVVQSFYWSHALLTVATTQFFDLGVNDLRVLSYSYNPNIPTRKEACDNISRTAAESIFRFNSAYITYDLTALTLGFFPMLPRWKVPDGIDKIGLSFDKEGRPDKKIKFYGMNKDDYVDSVVYTLINGCIQDTIEKVRCIHKTLGNYRQKELNLMTSVKTY
jgi:hypothetical protein